MFVMGKVKEGASLDLFKFAGDGVVCFSLEFQGADHVGLGIGGKPLLDPAEEFFGLAGGVGKKPSDAPHRLESKGVLLEEGVGGDSGSEGGAVDGDDADAELV
jgi:hypothetical protein